MASVIQPIPSLRLPRTGKTITRVGLGCMLLSSAGGPDRAAAKAVVQRAVERGVRLLDTADSYYFEGAEVGHNERLIAEALRGMGLSAGDDSPVVVATKGGQVRPNGAWRPAGTPTHLRSACHASLRALGVERIALYQLHIPDPSVPYSDSVGALARLKDEGKIAAIGLSNVSVEQLREAQSIAEVSSVQNRLSPWVQHRHTPVLRECERKGIPFLAYAPLGGRGRASALADDARLAESACSLDITPQELALAWLLHQSPSTVPIPSATRIATVDSIVRAASVQLDRRTKRNVSGALRRFPGSDGTWVRAKAKIGRLLGRRSGSR